MKFYVAGRVHDWERVRTLIEFLKSRGNICTHDWTRSSQFDENGPKQGEFGTTPLTPEQSSLYAKLDRDGVLECEELFFLGDLDGYTGTLIEVGIALGSRKVVHVIGPTKDCVFYHLPTVRMYNSYHEFFRYHQPPMYVNE